MDAKKALWRWLAVVLAVAVLVRVGLWTVYPLAESNDTQTYRHLSNSLRNHGFERYNGTRTPGYPLFLLLTGSDAALYLVQLTLGVFTTLLVFYIALKLSRLPWFAGILALAHTLNLGQLFFEGTLLSEALATFLLFAVFAGYLYFMECGSLLPRQRHTTSWHITAGLPITIGLAAAALAMVRPLFAPVAFWGAFFLLFLWRSVSWKTRWTAAILTALPTVIVLGLWVSFIQVNFKIWGLDSMGGYHLVNHVSSFFELAPDEYAPIRETFLHFRAIRVAESGSPVNTIWDAIPTLMEQEKRNYYSLGRLMGEISQRLITEHPDLYVKNLFSGWWWFWRVGVIWLPDTIAIPGLQPILRGLMLLERLALFGINLLFLAGSLALLWNKVRERLQPPLFIWFAASAVWMISILQTLAEHGDNPRFLAPMQTLVVLVVAWIIIKIRNTHYETHTA